MMIGTSEVPVRVCRGLGKPNLGTWPAFLARLCLCTLRHSWDTLVGKSGDEASTLNHARWFLSIHSIAMAMARVIMDDHFRYDTDDHGYDHDDPGRGGDSDDCPPVYTHQGGSALAFISVGLLGLRQLKSRLSLRRL